MAYFLHYHEALSAYTEERNNNYVEPWVSLTEESTSAIVNYNKTEEEKLLETPLTFEILSDGNIVWKRTSSSADPKTIEYSINGGNWTNITSSTAGTQFSVSNGDVVQFRGNNAAYGRYDANLSSNIFSGTTCQFKVKGNIMSLTKSTNFATLDIPGSYAFMRLFESCTGLTSASELILPRKSASMYCYCSMFYQCTSLVNAPKLPATSVYSYCYQNMFNKCTSLVKAPELPATLLYNSSSCYSGMFYGCTSLTFAPVLPSERVYSRCYESMFAGCSSLNYIKCLATYLSEQNSTLNWLSNVAPTGTFVKAKSMESWTVSSYGIPEGWTVQDA